ncbi:DUF3329 domain-containing protein [Mesorhizobium sp. AaZ16]|jgi:hypothetical protein|uniref:DUF3329 domain-containing protein n=1 Tax=Mesorhizobium sp. AaZ16 TaxID=3402289 RepID=UPI00374F5BC4
MAGEDHPFLRPLWRRVALVAFCVAWAIFEIFYGQSFWAMIAIGMAGYGAWIFLIAYKPGPGKEKE